MYNLEIENKYGERLSLTGNPAYEITQIDGLNPPEAVVNTTHLTGSDGAVFNSAYVDTRQIIMNIAINGPDAEANRLTLYRFFVSKYPVTIRIKNGSRDVEITGYVKQMPIEFFAKKQTVQVTVICPEPYFRKKTDNAERLVYVTPQFVLPVEFDGDNVIMGERTEFPSAPVTNEGDVEVGVRISFALDGAVMNPTITNATTGDYIQISSGLVYGDAVELSTVTGNKYVTVIRNGQRLNYLGHLSSGSSWIVLVPGVNTIEFSASSVASEFEIAFAPMFEGV